MDVINIKFKYESGNAPTAAAAAAGAASFFLSAVVETESIERERERRGAWTNVG